MAYIIGAFIVLALSAVAFLFWKRRHTDEDAAPQRNQELRSWLDFADHSSESALSKAASPAKAMGQVVHSSGAGGGGQTLNASPKAKLAVAPPKPPGRF